MAHVANWHKSLRRTKRAKCLLLDPAAVNWNDDGTIVAVVFQNSDSGQLLNLHLTEAEAERLETALGDARRQRKVGTV